MAAARLAFSGIADDGGIEKYFDALELDKLVLQDQGGQRHMYPGCKSTI